MRRRGNPGQVPTKPSLNQTPPRSSGSGPAQTGFSSRLEAAKKEMILILKETSNWPKDPVIVVTELLEIINCTPNLQEERFISASITPELQDLTERFVLVMEDVCGRLSKTYRKYGSNRELSDKMRHPFASLSKDGCAKALLGYRADIEKALAYLRDHLDDDPATQHPPKGQVNKSPGILDRTPNHSTPDAEATLAPQVPSTGPSVAGTQGKASSMQSPAPSPQKASPTNPNLPEQAEARRRERLDVARTTFETIEAISGTIPVVGSYVGAGAKVGLAVVRMIQAMDSNREMVKDLETRTARLSDRLGYFKNRSVEDRREEYLRNITELQSELQSIQGKIRELNSEGTVRNVVFSAGQAEALKGYQDTIRVALEELQLLVSLNTTNLLNELYDGEIRKEKCRLLDRLGDASYGARGNAINEVVCLPGTRVKVLERIDGWIRSTSPSEHVLWVRGMAGRGKSTIASTVAYNWRYRAAHAIFHFRRGQNALDQRLVCSLARQLGSSVVPEVKEAILQSIRENADIGQERLQEQFKVLFVASAERLQHNTHPILIVVDALDECEDTKYAVDFVNLIHQHASSFSAHFKFLLTTRPEGPLLRALEPRGWRMEDLDVVASIDDDIAELLQHRLSITRDDYGLGAEWPPQRAILSLVKMSQGLFQWAQTAVEYVSGGSPELRLEELLESPSLCDGLDSLYSQIISKAYETAKKRPGRGELLLHLLGTLAAAPYPVSPDIFTYLSSDQLMFRNKTQQHPIQLLRLEIASDIRSLVHIPESPSQPMRLVHTSVRDLLVDQRRCGGEPYFIDIGMKHRGLTTQSFCLMDRDLRQNMCRLFDLSKSNANVQDIVERELPKGLQYCCRSWSMHLIGGEWLSDTLGVEVVSTSLRTFSKTKLLSWLEVMSLTGATVEAMSMARDTRAWLQRTLSIESDTELATIWNDAHRFISTFLEPISFGALHIYASALPFCPTSTKIWEYYASQATSRILHGTQRVTWSLSLWARTAGGRVRATVFLQDGNVIASGSREHMIRLWDSETGAERGGPLMGHSDGVSVLVLSPDGKILASGSSIIRLWDVETGDLLCQLLVNHKSYIRSLAFSPDGKTLVSVWIDDKIRFWDCETGMSIGEPVTYHTGNFSRVALSPDAGVLAATLESSTVIQLWDTKTGMLLGEPLGGHCHSINCLAFSSDSNVLASGSDGGTIRLWSSRSGEPIQQLLGGGARWISAIAFSPSADILASGTSEFVIQLWDLKSGTRSGEYQTPHTDWIYHLTFSPNGKVLASGSEDRTLQLWDVGSAPPVTELLEQSSRNPWTQSVAFSPDGKVLASATTLKGLELFNAETGALLDFRIAFHNEGVDRIAFSSDGKVLASGARDGTICLWDTSTWALLGAPLQCHADHITAVAVSPDGRTLASASRDKTIRLWDVSSGIPLAEPQECPKGEAWSLAFSLDGNLLVSGHHHEMIRVWDATTGASMGETPSGELKIVISLGFLPDGKLVAKYWSREVLLYDVISLQRCDFNTTSECRAYKFFESPSQSLTFYGPWVYFLSQPLFCVPSRQWPRSNPQVSICRGRVAFLNDFRELFIMDVSRSLSL